jgi:AraC-like DNA-binding protein
MIISLSLIDLLMLTLLLQGFILGGLLLFSSRKIKSNRWIGLLILDISLLGLMPELDKQGLIWHNPRLLYALFPSTFVLGPLIYLYTRSLIFGGDKLPRKKYLHFLPMLLDMKHQVILFLFLTGILSIPAVENVYSGASMQHFLFLQDDLWKALLAMLSTVIYCIISYRLVVSYQVNNETSIYKLTDIKWVKKLLRIVFGLMLLWLFCTIITQVLHINSFAWPVYLLYVPAMIFVYWLGMSTYIRQSRMTGEEVVAYNRPPVKLQFAEDDAARYSRQLTDMVETDKLYLNPLIKIDDLAANLNISEKALSNLLNQYIGKNFNDFINEYRVEEAKKKLVDPALSQFTIAAIAYECGFNSLATFQRCFKQFTGITPSKYQNGTIPSKLQVNNTQIGI